MPGAPPAGSLTIDALQHRLIRYIGIKIPDAKNILVDRIERIVGGASRDTYRFRLQYSQQNQAVERFLIIRLDPADSLIDTERRIEFFAYQAFFKTDVPVPEMLWLEEDTGHLGTQFFIAVELTGLQSNAAVMLSPEFAPSHARLAEQKWSILGKMTRHDPAGLGLDRIMQPVTPETAWLRELNYWEHVLDKDEVTPQPVIRWAIRWLRANPPPPAQKITVVHGDYRSGNFLFDMQGNIHGILDWEMAHLGDPLEDLGWGFNRVWCFAKDDRRGGLLPSGQRPESRSGGVALVGTVQLRERPGHLGVRSQGLDRRQESRSDSGPRQLDADEHAGSSCA
jgi:aminoglycoside phosphotransferase (APT) family kinase protein